jgi:hypothetical protein
MGEAEFAALAAAAGRTLARRTTSYAPVALGS